MTTITVKNSGNFPDRIFTVDEFVSFLREHGENWNNGFGPICSAAANLIEKLEKDAELSEL